MSQYFYDAIYGLRQHEEIVLHDKLLQYIPEDEVLVQNFLQIEYDNESLNYPFSPPAFDAAAALWAAKTTYTSCQLILFRENKEAELPLLLPAYHGGKDAGAILSADLCLRFLPQIVRQTKQVDPDDQLIEIIDAHLSLWHYSGIGYSKAVLDVNDAIFNNDCLLQLYADRVVEKKDIDRAKQVPLLQKIKADMGIFSSVFWKTITAPDE